MKAIQLTKPGLFEIIGLPEVEARDLGPHDALVKVRHVGLCGTDIHAYHGRQPFFEYPRILGHELGVEVLAVGGEVRDIQPGMHCCVEAYLSEPGDKAYARGLTNCSASTKCLGVHVDGGMREHFILPAGMLHPSSLPTRSLALVEPLCIGHHAVERAGLIGDEAAAVIGLGPIGLGVAQFAVLAGVPVTVVDISEARLKTAAALFPGIQTLQLDPEAGLLESWDQAAGERPEVVWDCTGNKASMEAAIDLPAHGGKIVMVGLFKGSLTFSDPDFHRRELDILASRNARSGNFRAVIRSLEEGHMEVDPWISHECGMHEFPGLVDSWIAPGSGLLKGVIHFNDT